MDALDYARDLITFDSISPVSNCAVTDYVEEKLQSGFVFKNPNEKGRCGCGESFHV